MTRLHKLIALLIVCIIAFFMSGCSTLREPEELAWQALHVVDMAQTYDGAGDSCFREAHPISKLIISDQPTRKGIIAYGIGSAGVHLLISDQLLQHNMERAYRWWQTISIIDTAYATGKGYGIGIRLGKRNKLWCSK